MVTRKKPVIVNKPEDKFETVLFLPEGENRTGQGGLRTQGLFKHSLPDKPLITVITVVLNGAKHLEETILSVLNQTYDNVEYIIIDGGSTDETLDIIRKYEHAIDYWVSEKDEGIYDAMNKGIKCATGEVVGIINADDYYHANSLESISKAFESSEKIIYFGRLLYIDTDLCLQRV
ncbi:MAG: glycosyltransferase, partial [Desulfovibrionales bacterium]